MDFIKRHDFHRRALVVADKFFHDAPGYVLGDISLLRRMAATFDVFGAVADLPEWGAAMTQEQYIEVLNACNRAK